MRMKEFDEGKIYTSKDLQEEMNQERIRQGKSEMQAINPRGSGTGTLARKDTSWKNVPDFFRKAFGKKSQ